MKQQVEILQAPDDHSLVSEPVTPTASQSVASTPNSSAPPTEMQTWTSSEETIPDMSDGEDAPLLDDNDLGRSCPEVSCLSLRVTLKL